MGRIFSEAQRRWNGHKRRNRRFGSVTQLAKRIMAAPSKKRRQMLRKAPWSQLTEEERGILLAAARGESS